MIRRLTSTPLRVLLRRAFVILYVLAVALGVAGFVAVTAVTDRLDTLEGNLQPLATRNVAVLADMVDAETGLRGFELTGQKTFLQPYYQGTGELPRDLTAADDLARGSRTDTGLLVAERAAAENWITSVGAPQASGLVKPSAAGYDAGKALFDRFRATNTAVAASVRGRIAAARSGAHSARTWSLGVLGALLALTIGAGTYIGVRLLRRVVPPLEAVTGAILRLAGGERRVDVAEEGTAELVALARAVKHLDRENQRRHTEDRRRERLRILTGEVAREMADHLDLDDLLDRYVSITAAAFDVDRALIWLSEGDAPPRRAAEWRAAGLPGLEQKAGPDRAAEALDALLDELCDRDVLVCDDLGTSAALRPCSEAFGAETVVACRAPAGDDCLATLALFDGAPRGWEHDEVSAVERVTADMARAIRRAQLFADEKRLVGELEALDRAKADFVATVSHELRTPLTSVRGYVEMLRDGTATDDAVRDRMLGIVERNARRLQDLVDELLTLSRIEAGILPSSKEAVPVDHVLAKVAADLGPQATGGGVELDLEGVAGGVQVTGDPGQIEQIVVNLMSNAVKFTPPGGRVTLASRCEGSQAVITVADTGIGIPVEDQEKLGSRFFRASNATARAIPGTGLGVRIVQALVNHHHGTLALDSQPGRGTTWTLRLPLAIPDDLTIESV